MPILRRGKENGILARNNPEKAGLLAGHLEKTICLHNEGSLKTKIDEAKTYGLCFS